MIQFLKNLFSNDNHSKTLNTSFKAHNILWERVLGARKLGHTFAKNVKIDKYYYEFYCKSLNLVIELGSKQLEDSDSEYQSQKSSYLFRNGYKYFRFDENEVILKTDNIKNQIIEIINDINNSKLNIS